MSEAFSQLIGFSQLELSFNMNAITWSRPLGEVKGENPLVFSKLVMERK